MEAPNQETEVEERHEKSRNWHIEGNHDQLIDWHTQNEST